MINAASQTYQERLASIKEKYRKTPWVFNGLSEEQINKDQVEPTRVSDADVARLFDKRNLDFTFQTQFANLHPLTYSVLRNTRAVALGFVDQIPTRVVKN